MAQQILSSSIQAKIISQRPAQGHVQPKTIHALKRVSAPKVQRRILSPLCAATSPSPGGDYTTELANAEKRWEDQIRDGRVKSISASAAGELKQEGWVFLDVRPPTEVAKAGVEGSIEIPIYIPETEWSVVNLLKQASNFGLGGWWLGGSHMIPNQQFLREVQTKIPKDAKVIVACQKGLRSLSAAEQLSRAGYTTIAWVNGGLDTAKKTDLPVVNSDDLRYGGIGGLSELLGWNDVQREKNAGALGGPSGPIKLAAGVLLLDGVWFAYDYIQEFLHKGGQ
ncbi:hypothetical protein WJX75_000141 [Coccomyxa subellipsoidea]|uniref:Rhodanese domain-containing protein n=1 Tax=Coccomyxa subellipsoidea TaxID=248742 RepID=A0ABR2YH19_9CHLO